jgi:hypothetical protein
MIFISCKDGISHNEIEHAQPEHITAGCNLLLHAMLARAGMVCAAPGFGSVLPFVLRQLLAA